MSCGDCGAPLPTAAIGAATLVPCSGCGTPARVVVFPAFLNARVEGERPEVRNERDASCFYHPDKRAHVPCDACGRFLCTLCDIEVGAEHFCPRCLETQAKTGKKPELENERLLHDSITLALAVVPILLWFVTPITGPIAVYRAIRYWNRPSSILRRNRWRLVVAALVGLGQIFGWALVGFLVFSKS